MVVIIINENDYLVSIRLQNKLHQYGSRDTTSKWSTLFYIILYIFYKKQTWIIIILKNIKIIYW